MTKLHGEGRLKARRKDDGLPVDRRFENGGGAHNDGDRTGGAEGVLHARGQGAGEERRARGGTGGVDPAGLPTSW